MPSYTDLVAVKAEIPNTPPSNPSTGESYSSDDWNTKLSSIISSNSQLVDDAVGGNYLFAYKDSTQKFPDITDSPATPGTIQAITRDLAICEALGYYSINYVDADNAPRLRRRNNAEKKLKDIREGVIKISVEGTNLFTVATNVSYTREDVLDDERPDMNIDTMDSLL